MLNSTIFNIFKRSLAWLLRHHWTQPSGGVDLEGDHFENHGFWCGFWKILHHLESFHVLLPHLEWFHMIWTDLERIFDLLVCVWFVIQHNDAYKLWIDNLQFVYIYIHTYIYIYIYTCTHTWLGHWNSLEQLWCVQLLGGWIVQHRDMNHELCKWQNMGI